MIASASTNSKEWIVEKKLPVLDIVAVILSLLSIIVSILIAGGILGIHQKLNQDQINEAKMHEEQQKKMIELLEKLDLHFDQNNNLAPMVIPK